MTQGVEGWKQEVAAEGKEMVSRKRKNTSKYKTLFTFRDKKNKAGRGQKQEKLGISIEM